MTDEDKVERPVEKKEVIADSPPYPKEMWEIRRFVDPETGVAIEMAVSIEPLITPRFRSSVNVMTNRGPATIQFDIPNAQNIEEARQLYVPNAKAAVEEMKQKMKENERRIVVPGMKQAPFPLKPNGGIN